MSLFNTCLKFLITNLLVIRKGTFVAKLKATIGLAMAFSPFTFIADSVLHWGINNQVYISFVLGAIVVDYILGSIKHLAIDRDFSIRKNINGILIKLGLAVSMGFLFEGVNYLVVHESMLKTYLTIVLRLVLFLYPAGSAFMNSHAITDGAFPPIGWIEKITKFNKNLDIKDFNGGNRRDRNHDHFNTPEQP